MAGEWVVDLAARWAALGFEAAGVAAIVLVSFAATLRYVRASRKVGDWLGGLAGYRADLGRGVLLGLDILGTIAASPSLETLGVLALVILIRIVLSVSLNVEVDGAWPWRRRSPERPNAGGIEA